jgi:hypothetical protein
MVSEASKRLASRFIPQLSVVMQAPQPILALPPSLSDKITRFTPQPMTVPTLNAVMPQPSIVNHQANLDEIMSKCAGCRGRPPPAPFNSKLPAGAELSPPFRHDLRGPCPAGIVPGSPFKVRV